MIKRPPINYLERKDTRNKIKAIRKSKINTTSIWSYD